MPAQGVSTDEVRLVLPAQPEYVRLARLTAAGLASRMGFNYDEVEDLRIAVDELCYLLVGADGRGGTIVLSFHADPLGMRITGEGAAMRYETGVPKLLAEQILAAVVDEYDVTQVDGLVKFWMMRYREAL